MQRSTVLLLFGGESPEHEVSIASARNVFAAIDDSKYEVILGFIGRDGKWWLLDAFDDYAYIHAVPQLVPVPGAKSFVTIPAGKVLRPDVILPILHGKNGEDGSVQALAQLLHIPVAGCDMTASVLMMDKVATKQILQASGIVVVPYEVHRKGNPTPDFNHLSMKLGSPMFVKPSRGGSTIGVTKVYSEDEFLEALELAHTYDTAVLIERGISGRELEVAVLGNPPHHRVSAICEVKLKEGIYDYEAKYAPDSPTEFVIPAQLSSDVTDKVLRLASRVYALLGCTGLARVDFFLGDDGVVYVNELNTIPGFTNKSVYPMLWRESGIGYGELIDRLISLALPATITSNETEG